MGRTRSYPGSSTSLPVVLAVLGSATLSAPPASAQVTRVWDGAPRGPLARPGGRRQLDRSDGHDRRALGGRRYRRLLGVRNRYFLGICDCGHEPGPVRASGIEVTNSFYFIFSEFDPITGKSDPLELVGAPTSTIRVDDNAGALIFSDLTGNTRLRKTGPGELLLLGLNSYSGGTDIDGGTLAVSLHLPASGPLSIDGGTLASLEDSFLDVAAPITLEAGGGTIAGILSRSAEKLPASAH